MFLNKVNRIHHWEQFLSINIPTFFIDSLTVYDGTYSVKMSSGEDHVMDFELYQDIQPSNFVSGAQYQFSFWIKNDTPFDLHTFGIFMREENTNTVLIHENPLISSISDWQQFSYEFTVPYIPTAQYYRLRIGFNLWHHSYLAWFDKVEIFRVE